MDRLKMARLLFLAAVCLIAVPALCVSSESSTFFIDWGRCELSVSGSAEITPKESGNVLAWQYGAALAAQKEILRGFIRSLDRLRVGAFDTARDVLLEEPVKNENIYRFVSEYRRREVFYSDRLVKIKAVFPFFGETGFVPLFIEAGRSRGSFPGYAEFVHSISFTGLVVDARGLGRKPAIAPRIFDGEHMLIYSIDTVRTESFAKWGGVRYTKDPDYRGIEPRVGANPLRLVALKDEKLIETDIALATSDAMTLMQDVETRANLEQGKVIIIIDAAGLEEAEK
jgi:hypothetical protein